MVIKTQTLAHATTHPPPFHTAHRHAHTHNVHHEKVPREQTNNIQPTNTNTAPPPLTLKTVSKSV